MGGTADGELQISGVDCDSRRIEQGFVFVAVRGYDADGHAFISAAAEKGAAAVICEEPPAIDIPYVLVKDSRYALAIASRDFYRDPASKMTVVAVTGTCGKTTSTYLIKHLLEAAAGAKVGLVGTNGNMIGEKLIHTERTTPESCELQKLFREMLDEGCTHVVMEVSSHSLVLDRVAGIHFNVGIFTNMQKPSPCFFPAATEPASIWTTSGPTS